MKKGKIALTSIIILFIVVMVTWSLSQYVIRAAGRGRRIKITDNGTVKTIEQFDQQGRRHGVQKTFVNGRLVNERTVEHGHVVEMTEYHFDGTVKGHWKEDENYQLKEVNPR